MSASYPNAAGPAPLQICRGQPTAEEIAAVIAALLVMARNQATSRAATPARPAAAWRHTVPPYRPAASWRRGCAIPAPSAGRRPSCRQDTEKAIPRFVTHLLTGRPVIVADLMVTLRAGSRFEAGVKAARIGWL